MADSSVLITVPGTGTAIDVQVPTGGDARQTVTIGDGTTVAGVAPVDATRGLRVNEVAAGTPGTPAAAAASTTSAQVLAANSNRLYMVVQNLGPATVFILLGTGTATATTTGFSFKLAPGQIWESASYAGRIAVITAAGTSTVQATEVTA